jgi:hypothetical protein
LSLRRPDDSPLIGGPGSRPVRNGVVNPSNRQVETMAMTMAEVI